MRFPSRIFSFLLFLLFLGAGRVEASFISMVTDHRVESKEDGVVTRMKVTNKGDETAYNVRVSAELEGEIKKGSLQDELKVNESLEVVLEFPHKFEKAGKYPVIVSVDYTDLNRYPFTAISIGEADYKERLIGRVAGQIEAKPFSKSGKISGNHQGRVAVYRRYGPGG